MNPPVPVPPRRVPSPHAEGAPPAPARPDQEAGTAAVRGLPVGPPMAAPQVAGGTYRPREVQPARHAAETADDASAGLTADTQDRLGELQAELAARIGGGEPLPSLLRARFEASTGQDLRAVRVHSGVSAVARLGARALTVGTDIAVAPGEPPLGSPAGNRLVSHEVVHVAQQLAGGLRGPAGGGSGPMPDLPAEEAEAHQATADLLTGRPARMLTPVPGPVVQFQDSSVLDPTDVGAVCEVPIGTFVLDPALESVPPPQVTTQVRVAPHPGENTERFVEIPRPVRSVTRVAAFAVNRADVYDNPVEASTATGSDLYRDVELEPGDLAWTLNGMFTVTGVAPGLVFGDAPVPETVAAAVVVLVRTDAGPVLLDNGMQLSDPALAEPVAAEITRRLTQELPDSAIGEAVLMPGAPDGHVLPAVAARFAIGSVRATVDQYNDPRTRETVEAVQKAHATYRQWLESSLRAELDAGRAEWEATQPIAPNAGIRELRWRKHVELTVADQLGKAAPARLLLAEDTGGLITLPDDSGIRFGDLRAPTGALTDLTGVQWERADDGLIIVLGDDKLHLIPARGLLWRPVTPPAFRTIPGLRPAPPTGVTPMAAKPATPWVAASAIGKEAQVMVRTGMGPGVMIDAGGAERFAPLTAIADMATRLGVSGVDTILVTHAHIDHVKHVVKLVETYNIPPSKLIVSENWTQFPKGELRDVILALKADTPAMRGRGYGPSWNPGVAVARTGVPRFTVQVAGGTVDVLALGEAQKAVADRAAAGKMPSSPQIDSSSLLYIMGNETSKHRVAVVGDLRGTDIAKLADRLGEDAFREALRGVRVIVGFGHHMGKHAAGTEADVRGWQRLFSEALRANGELTIVVQSSESFVFGSDAAGRAHGQALLDFATRMGARVVFAGEPIGPGGTVASGGAVIQSNLQVHLHGSGVTMHEAEPRVRDALERLQMLKEAARTLQAEGEIGLRHLRLPGAVADVQAGLQTEITRLSGTLTELSGRHAVALYEARGEWEDATEAARKKAAFRTEQIRSTLTLDQVYDQLAQKGPVETALAPEVVAGLRAAVRHGSTLTVEAELSKVPRAVAEAVQRLPEARRTSLETKYREMADLVGALEGDKLPAAKHLEVLGRAEGLLAELKAAQGELPAESRPALETEVRRLEDVVTQLGKDVVTKTRTTRDLEGRVTKTEYRALRGPDKVEKFYGRVGQAFGALMVVHSVYGAATTAAGVLEGDVNLTEAAVRTVHSAYGIDIGIRMLKGSHVGMGEFVVMAVLEIGAAVAADYETEEERDYAILGTAIRSTVNLLCLRAGMWVMGLGAKVPHPVGKFAVMGIGLAITMAGEKILSFFGLDDNLVRWTSFPPGEVTEVHQEISETLDEYEIIVGAQRIADRDARELRALGFKDPTGAKEEAKAAVREHTGSAHEKEKELVGLFEKAYERAADSYVGLRALDALAARFTRLRHLALPGDDSARAALQERFLRLDEKLDLSHADATRIRSMEQWTELDQRLRKLDAALVAKDFDEVFEHLDKAEQVIANARYRIDPAGQGGFRPVPMIPAGTPAHAAYVQELAARERQFAALLFHASVLGAGTPGVVVTKTELAAVQSGGTDPRAALARLQALRVAYDARVAEAKKAVPGLSGADVWSNSFALGQKVEQAHRDHPGLFQRLRLTEMALRSAIGQARSALTTAGGTAGGTVDQTLAGMVEREVAGADRAIEERKTMHGLVFPGELDPVLTERRALEDQTLAAVIDAAYPRARLPGTGGPEPTPLSPEEIKALRTDELEDVGGKLSSTEQQLGRAWEHLAPIRALGPKSTLSDPASWSRVARNLLRVKGSTVYTYEPGFIDSSDTYTVPAGMEPIVAQVGESILGREGWGFHGPIWFHTVIALNADALAVFGPGAFKVSDNNVEPITVEKLQRLAEQRGKAPAGSGGP